MSKSSAGKPERHAHEIYDMDRLPACGHGVDWLAHGYLEVRACGHGWQVMPAGVITGCDFIDVDARFGDFRGTIFQQCAFYNVNFRAAKLENAKFIDCYFDNVDFRMTEMEEPYAKYLAKLKLNAGQIPRQSS